ncbi:hypothetical protein F3Y22_tig00116944pilonHSYRG00294 [Hibiscus syriacus]|uniref:Uncharacterized protein n=1 Tax=Hibiscus syriacus TaxID=106335 RepID=A0A6A2WZ41_HIBSY|nr:hypothetical protein F3Y22_tig00116944pilonHSYRG00294 [Hibiscus syriacus]
MSGLLRRKKTNGNGGGGSGGYVAQPEPLISRSGFKAGRRSVGSADGRPRSRRRKLGTRSGSGRC